MEARIRGESGISVPPSVLIMTMGRMVELKSVAALNHDGTGRKLEVIFFMPNERKALEERSDDVMELLCTWIASTFLPGNRHVFN